MRPTRQTKTRAAAMVAGLATAALVATATTNITTSAAAPAAVVQASQPAAAGKAVSITVLPGIAQPGSNDTGSAKAKAVVTARFSGIATGGPAVLERKAGSSWKTAGRTLTTVKGDAEFLIPRGSNSTYRVVALKFRGKPEVTSDEADAGVWGSASFADQFAGRRLSGNWSSRGGEYNAEGLRACSKGSPKAVKVGGGTVRLSVLVDKSKGKKKCVAKAGYGRKLGRFSYRLNGHISTSGEQGVTYGVAAARIKFQRLKGQHASFWMQPTVGDLGGKSAKTSGAEIDVIEWFGEKGRSDSSELTSFIYHPTKRGLKKEGTFIKDSNSFLSSRSDDWYKQYHVFSVEWNKSAYVFRIDGRETWRTTKGISGIEEFPILSLLSSDYELPSVENEKRDLPQHMYVDWVQLWQADPKTGLAPTR